MKKVLVSLLVLALAVSGAFAAVNFSGNLVTGYVLNWNGDAFKSYIFGQDNTDTNSTKLNLGAADDNGYWSVGLEGEIYLDGSAQNDVKQNRVMGDLTVDLAKIIAGPESDWSAQLSLVAFDRITGLRAYSNKSGLSYDRIRTAEQGLWTSLTIGYTDLVQFQIGGAPTLSVWDKGANKLTGDAKGDFIVSALVKPLDGLSVSAGWALVGNKDVATAAGADGEFNAAVDVNIAKLAGLDFDLGVGVADRINFGSEIANGLAAQVYGGGDVASGYVEYVLDGDISRLHAGVDLNVVENMILNLYGGAGDFSAENGNWYVGGNVGYSVSGITFQLNLQYAAGDYMTSKGGDIAQGAVKAEGFSVTPMLKVNF